MEGSGRPGAAEVWASPAEGHTRRGCSRCCLGGAQQEPRPTQRERVPEEYDLAQQAVKDERWLLWGDAGVRPGATGRGG